MRRFLILASIAAAGAASPAGAQSTGRAGSASVGITGGTLGIGPEVDYRVSDLVAIRANGTFLSASHDVDSDDISYNGKLKLSSVGAMLDFYPTQSGFRLSAGARASSNKVRLRATPTGDVEVGDVVYTPAEVGVLSGDVKANSLAPTLTLGWSGGAARGVSFGFEAGGMFHGSPKVRNLKATGLLATDPDFQEQLAIESRELEDDIDYKIYPIVQVSLGYRF